MRPLRAFIETQTRMSAAFERRLPEQYRIDGNRDFVDSFVGPYLFEGARVYDVGGGKNPLIDRETKARLRLDVVGLDIDAEELARAPEGLYDRSICADVTAYRGEGDADLVICQALLEHVRDTDAAIAAISSMLKPGGVALLFVPSGNAVFARLNRLLPQRLKQALLYVIYPQTRRNQGFPAYYDRCTPHGLRSLAEVHGLQVQALRVYFSSSYFTFLFPLHVAWRAWILLFRTLAGEQAAESSSIALSKCDKVG